MINKVAVQEMIDKLEQHSDPIDMASPFSCAACIIANRSIYSDAIDKIEEETGIDCHDLYGIFCNYQSPEHLEDDKDLKGNVTGEWIYHVDHAADVTKEMVIDQLKKYL